MAKSQFKCMILMIATKADCGNVTSHRDLFASADDTQRNTRRAFLSTALWFLLRQKPAWMFALLGLNQACTLQGLYAHLSEQNTSPCRECRAANHGIIHSKSVFTLSWILHVSCATVHAVQAQILKLLSYFLCYDQLARLTHDLIYMGLK